MKIYLKITRKDYEKHLNEMLKDCFSFSQALHEYIYLASQNTKPRTSKSHLKQTIVNGELGSLIRRVDPIRFNVGFNEYKANKGKYQRYPNH